MIKRDNRMLGLLRNRRRIHIHTFCYWARTNKTKKHHTYLYDDSAVLWFIASCPIQTIHRFNCFLPFAVGCDLAFRQHLCEVSIDTLFKNENFWFARIIRFFSRHQNWHLCLRFWNLPSFFFSFIENKRVTSLQK